MFDLILDRLGELQLYTLCALFDVRAGDSVKCEYYQLHFQQYLSFLGVWDDNSRRSGKSCLSVFIWQLLVFMDLESYVCFHNPTI